MELALLLVFLWLAYLSFKLGRWIIRHFVKEIKGKKRK